MLLSAPSSQAIGLRRLSSTMAASAACQQRQLGATLGRQAATAPLLPPRRRRQQRRCGSAVRAVADPNELLQLASSTAGSLQTVAADLAAALPAGVTEPVVAAASTLATGGPGLCALWLCCAVLLNSAVQRSWTDSMGCMEVLGLLPADCMGRARQLLRVQCSNRIHCLGRLPACTPQTWQTWWRCSRRSQAWAAWAPSTMPSSPAPHPSSVRLHCLLCSAAACVWPKSRLRDC